MKRLSPNFTIWRWRWCIWKMEAAPVKEMILKGQIGVNNAHFIPYNFQNYTFIINKVLNTKSKLSN